MKIRNVRNSLLIVGGLSLLGGISFSSCGSSEPQKETVEVVIPTEGLITTVKEVEKGKFKIDDEQTVDKPEDSRIIANYIDMTSDTFTLEEAKLISSTEGDKRSSAVRSAGMGYFGFLMLGRMGGFTPTAGAYTSAAAHNRVSNSAGSKMTSSANRVTRTRPAKARSGYGSGKSTRSYGG